MEALSDKYFMRLAFKEAQLAFEKGEIPVGAVIVSNKEILAKGHNLTEKLKDVTAHAEIMCITAAANHLGSKYLNDCTLYVTLEPCVMCAGALAWAQIGRIVIGAADTKRGYQRVNPNLLHPKTVVNQGLMSDECSQLLKDFFVNKRG